MNLFDMEPSRAVARPVETAWSFRRARIVQVALRLGVFAALAEPRSISQLCTALESDPEMTERLLIALAALDLVRQDHNVWRNELPAMLYLVPDSPLFQGAEIERAAAIWDLFHHLERLVRKGRSDAALRALLDHTQEHERWQDAFHALAVAGHAQRLVRVVKALGSCRKVLDIGGARGCYSVALCQRYAALHCTVMESEPAVLEETRQAIAYFDMVERVNVVAQLWQRHGWGDAEYDALLLSHVVVGSESKALTWFARAYRALTPGGLFVLQGHWLNNDLQGPEEAAHLHMLRGTYTLGQITSLVAEAGFEQIQLQHRGPPGQDILSARKPFDEALEEDDLLMAYVSPEQELFGTGAAPTEDGLSIQRTELKQILHPN